MDAEKENVFVARFAQSVTDGTKCKLLIQRPTYNWGGYTACSSDVLQMTDRQETPTWRVCCSKRSGRTSWASQCCSACLSLVIRCSAGNLSSCGLSGCGTRLRLQRMSLQMLIPTTWRNSCKSLGTRQGSDSEASLDTSSRS